MFQHRWVPGETPPPTVSTTPCARGEGPLREVVTLAPACAREQGARAHGVWVQAPQEGLRQEGQEALDWQEV